MSTEFVGKVALITGAGSGIGKATAYALGRAGYATVLADVDEGIGRKVHAELVAEEHPSHFVACDVAQEAQVQAAVDRAVAIFGRLDIAFNDAGIEGDQADTASCTLENWNRVIDVNLKGVWLCMRAEIRQMVRQGSGGVIVNCASVAGLVGMPGLPAYVAAKHGVVGLTKSAALEFATRNIRVNAICPGAIATPMLDRYMAASPTGHEQILAAEPVGRIGTPDEIASAVLWLVSNGAAFTTGQALAVDGGWTAR